MTWTPFWCNRYVTFNEIPFSPIQKHLQCAFYLQYLVPTTIKLNTKLFLQQMCYLPDEIQNRRKANNVHWECISKWLSINKVSHHQFCLKSTRELIRPQVPNHSHKKSSVLQVCPICNAEVLGEESKPYLLR